MITLHLSIDPSIQSRILPEDEEPIRLVSRDICTRGLMLQVIPVHGGFVQAIAYRDGEEYRGLGGDALDSLMACRANVKRRERAQDWRMV